MKFELEMGISIRHLPFDGRKDLINIHSTSNTLTKNLEQTETISFLAKISSIENCELILLLPISES